MTQLFDKRKGGVIDIFIETNCVLLAGLLKK
jgi:hypothetical protein